MPTKKVMYEGKEVEAIDCTPTWEAAIMIHLAVLDNPKASTQAREGAKIEIMRAAKLADKYNEVPVTDEQLPPKKKKKKEFFWKDKSGRGFTNTFSLSGIKKAFSGEKNDDGQAASAWAQSADVGDEFDNSTNHIVRTK